MSFEEVDQCGICLQKISNRTVVEACLHSFCSECISNHLTESAQCPTCLVAISCVYFDIKDDQTFSTLSLEIPTENVQGTQEQKIPETIDFIEDYECPICFEEYVDRATLEGCFHNFCFKCITDWSKKSKSCPLCSRDLSVIYHNAKENHEFEVYEVGKDGAQLLATHETRPAENVQMQPSTSNVQPTQVPVVQNEERNFQFLQVHPSFKMKNQLQSAPYQDVVEQRTEQNPTTRRVDAIQLPQANMAATSSQNSLFQTTPFTALLNAVIQKITPPIITLPNVTVPNITLPNVTVPNVALPNITLPNVTVPNVTLPNVALPNITLPNITLPNVTVPNVTLPNVASPIVASEEVTNVRAGLRSRKRLSKDVASEEEETKCLRRGRSRSSINKN